MDMKRVGYREYECSEAVSLTYPFSINYRFTVLFRFEFCTTDKRVSILNFISQNRHSLALSTMHQRQRVLLNSRQPVPRKTKQFMFSHKPVKRSGGNIIPRKKRTVNEEAFFPV